MHTESDVEVNVSAFVKFSRAEQFIEKVNAELNCKIIKVSEWISNELLEYIIECPETKQEYIAELAFMTFISNPKFQKYYDE